MPLRLQGAYFVFNRRRWELTSCRNREGLNDWIFEREHPDEKKAEP